MAFFLKGDRLCRRGDLLRRWGDGERCDRYDLTGGDILREDATMPRRGERDRRCVELYLGGDLMLKQTTIFLVFTKTNKNNKTIQKIIYQPAKKSTTKKKKKEKKTQSTKQTKNSETNKLQNKIKDR